MDLTPDVLRDIEFRRKGRGYDADDVDAFRQQVEVWSGEMQARLREATSKLDEAETRARDAEERARTSTEGDETIQRTLLLAQRTADAAVAEAEETASRKVAEAEAEADRLLTEARNHREQAIAGAEAEVREAIDVKRAELLDELTSLERVRDALVGDVAALEVHVEGQRARIEEVRDQLGVLLEHPLAPVPEPGLSGVDVPDVAPLAPVAIADPIAEPELEPEPAPVELADELERDTGTEADPFAAEPVEPVVAEAPDPVATEPADDAWAPEPVAAGESVFGETPPVESGAAVDEAPGEWDTATDDVWADTPPPPPPPPPGLEVDEAAWADAPPPPPPPPPDFDAPGAEQGSATFGGLSGPAVPEQLPELDDQAEEDNPWLAELSDQETGAEDGRSRFGRRR